jgi:putative photosynthetic complex assembly protein
MSQQLTARSFPRAPLIGAGLLILFSLTLVTTARLTGIGVMHSTQSAPALAMRDLRFEDRLNGAVIVYDASNGLEVDRLQPGTGGFVRGILRSFARGRRAIQEVEIAEPPFRLVQSKDGGLSLEDIMTRRVVELNAFGPTNAAAFARFLNAKEPGE